MLALYSRYLNAKEALKKMMLKNDEGQTIVEYVLLIVMIALIVLATQPGLTSALLNSFNRIADSVNYTGS